MGRKKEGRINITRRVRPEFIPIIDAFLKQLELNEGMVAFQGYVPPPPPKPEPIEPPKERFGITPNDFLKSLGKGCMIMDTNVSKNDEPDETNYEEEKDYTEWQNNNTMVEVDRAVSWGWASCGPEDSQIPPDEGFDILQRNGKLATQLVDAKRNGKTAKYNELMTELYERIKG